MINYSDGLPFAIGVIGLDLLMEELKKNYPDPEAILKELIQRSLMNSRPKLRECQLESLRDEKCYPNDKEFQLLCENDIIKRNHNVCSNKNIKDIYFKGTKEKIEADFQQCCNSSCENELYYLFFLVFILLFILFILTIYKYRTIIKRRCLEYFKHERKSEIKEKKQIEPPLDNELIGIMFPIKNIVLNENIEPNNDHVDSGRLESVSDTAKRDIYELKSNESRCQINSPPFFPIKSVKIN